LGFDSNVPQAEETVIANSILFILHQENLSAMNLDPVPVFITAASMTFLSIRAVVADRFRNPITNTFVLLGGIMPWFTIALFSGWLPESRIVPFLGLGGLFGSGPIFFAAMVRYAWGHRLSNWERAAGASGTAVLAALGFYISVAAFRMH
jgi:hypothetical protein